MSWAAALVDKPYSFTGQGPEEFNCWALVRHALKVGHGIDVPAICFDTESGWRAVELRSRMQKQWTRFANAKAGDILCMVGTQRDLHVGLCLDSVRVLHTWSGAGRSTIQRMSDLRLLGFGRFEAWRYTH